jgi:flagellar biogenesis protein FliO
MKHLAALGALLTCATLASSAAAEDVAPAAASAQPVVLRPSKPVTLATKDEGSSWAKGVGVVVLLGAAAFYVVRRRKQQLAPASARAEITIQGRTSVGHRGELVVVRVHDSTLLLGITGSSITTLASLESKDTADEAENEPIAPEPAVDPFGKKLAALLGQTQCKSTRAPVISLRAVDDDDDDDRDGESQARSLRRRRGRP